MKLNNPKAVAAILPGVATIVASIFMTSCEGRRMSNMVPTGDTVEVIIEQPQEVDTLDADTLSNQY